MWQTILQKLLKSELWVALGAVVVAALAPRLGIPQETLTEFWVTIGTVAAAYIAGRSYAKPRELAGKDPS